MVEITGEIMKKIGRKIVIDWICNLCYKDFIKNIIPRDWKRSVTVLFL